MTDVERVQAVTAEATPAPPRAQVQVVPLRGLPIVAAVVVFVTTPGALRWPWCW